HSTGRRSRPPDTMNAIEKKKPTVVFVTMIFEPEPGNVRGLPLATWLAHHGYDVKVITGFPNYPIGRTYDGYKQRLWQWEQIGDVWPESATESGLVTSGLGRKLIAATMRRWCRFLYRRADWMTALSPGFKRLLVERGAPEERTEVIYNWADESQFSPVPRDPA